jgi:O-antigen/teichoic acid export membrane protein
MQHTRPVIRAGRLGGALAELRPMAGLSVAEGGARLLSFLYYLLAARALAPEGFGELRYTIVLATFAFGLLQVLSWTLTRELGAGRGSETQAARVLGTGLGTAAVLWLVSAVGCVAAAAAGVTGSAGALGLVAVLSGLAAFQLYYAVARGLGRTTLAAAGYLGASASQLAVFALLVTLADPGPMLALLVFGISSIVPVLVLELARPLVPWRALRPSRDMLRAIAAIAAPLAVGELGYLVWTSADQVWVESRLGSGELGLYAAAKNLAQVFVVVPSGVAGVLLPRVAELRVHGERRRARLLVGGTTAGLLGGSALLAAATGLLAEPLLGALYGERYEPASEPYVWLAVAMTAYAGFTALTTAAIGWGRPGIYGAGIGLAAIVEVAWLLLATDGDTTTAAIAFAASIGAGLVLVVALLVRAVRRT